MKLKEAMGMKESKRPTADEMSDMHQWDMRQAVQYKRMPPGYATLSAEWSGPLLSIGRSEPGPGVEYNMMEDLEKDLVAAGITKDTIEANHMIADMYGFVDSTSPAFKVLQDKLRELLTQNNVEWILETEGEQVLSAQELINSPLG